MTRRKAKAGLRSYEDQRADFLVLVLKAGPLYWHLHFAGTDVSLYCSASGISTFFLYFEAKTRFYTCNPILIFTLKPMLEMLLCPPQLDSIV